jgi:sigma-B regulation protein RsbU (phosphoserine phosphatase)
MERPNDFSERNAEPRGTILVVDDGPENRLFLRAMLERGGYRVLVADCGEAALALLDEQPDLIVLDYMMPGMDGPDVARRVRAGEKSQDVPIIMLTASHEEPHIEEAFAAGATDYITKPVDRRILTARVESTIRAASDSRRAKEAAATTREWGAILTDLNEAARIQQGKLPSLPARAGRWLVAGALVSSRQIGGDLFGLMAGPDDGHILALADVSGHGMAAALVAASLLGDLRTVARSHPLPAALHAINGQLCEENGDKYACVGAIAFHGETATVVNAGLPPVCVLRGGRCVAELSGAGVPPGLVAYSEYQEEILTLAPGDRLVLMSDGLTEPFGGADQVAPCLERIGLLDPALDVETLTPAVLAERIRNLLRSSGQQEHDDAALLIAELRG